MNCPACLPGGRYDIPKLRKWIAEHSEELKAVGETLSLKDQKTNEEIRKLKIANDQKEGKLVDRAKAAAKAGEMASKVRDLVYAKLVNEYPGTVSTDVATNRALGRILAEQLLSEFQGFAREWETL